MKRPSSLVNTCAPFAIALALVLSACDAYVAPPDHQSDRDPTGAPGITNVQASRLSVAPPDGFVEAAPTYIAFAKNNKMGALASAVEARGGTMPFSHAGTGFVVIAGVSADDAAALAAQGLVSDIQADPAFPMELPAASTPDQASIDSPTNPAAAFFFPRQWNMRTIGADDAWAAGKLGSGAVTVAILDTGIGYEHPDLQGRVDLDRSISFVPNDDVYTAFYFPGRHPITDIGYHGTHVAATVASNGIAAAGVTSQTTLMGVKVCSVVSGNCPGSAVFAGLLYAADNGADIINMSLGGSFMKRDYPGYVGYLNKIFSYISRQGALVVVSAGNDAVDLDHDGNSFKTYCNVAGVLCVSATGPTAAASINGPWTEIDAPAAYTNYGRSAINVAAPGGNTGASVSAACSPTSLLVPICQTGTYVVGISGTSMAAPHASGLAALLSAEGYNASRIITKMQQSADDLGQRGTDPFYGKGRINVAKALGI